MTAYDDFDRTLAGWLETDSAAPVPRGGLHHVIDATQHRKPRPGWLAGLGSDWVGEAPDVDSSAGAHTPPLLGTRGSIAIILLLATVAIVGGAILVGALVFQPPPLPTGRLGHLAYGLDGDIYVAAWDGANPVRIADGVLDPGGGGPASCGSFWGEGPMWSPDGRHLAYRSTWDDSCRATSGEGKVYISDPAGHVIASVPGTGWLVSWSPDSTRVATSVDLGHTFGIYGLDGVRQALLTVPAGYEVHGDYSPVWSPDGTSLLMPIAPITPSSPSEIWEFPIDGAAPRKVPEADPRTHLEASYSSDGARVAFIAYPESESLAIDDADGTELRVLPGAVIDSNGVGQGPSYANPVVSPTGDRVAFVWSPIAHEPIDPSEVHANFRSELRVVDVASGSVSTLASASDPVSLDPIRFSSDGDQLLFSKTDANNASSLWSVNADGSNLQVLVTGTGWGDWQTSPARP